MFGASVGEHDLISIVIHSLGHRLKMTKGSDDKPQKGAGPKWEKRERESGELF